MGPQRENVVEREDKRDRIFGRDRKNRTFFRKWLCAWIEYCKEPKTLAQVKKYAEAGKQVKNFGAALRARFDDVPRTDGHSLLDTRYLRYFSLYTCFCVTEGQLIHACDDEGDSGDEESEEDSVIRDFPYQHGDWRVVGDRSRIIRAFSELNGYPVYAMHNNVVLDKYVPDGWT